MIARPRRPSRSGAAPESDVLPFDAVSVSAAADVATGSAGLSSGVVGRVSAGDRRVAYSGLNPLIDLRRVAFGLLLVCMLGAVALRGFWGFGLSGFRGFVWVDVPLDCDDEAEPDEEDDEPLLDEDEPPLDELLPPPSGRGRAAASGRAAAAGRTAAAASSTAVVRGRRRIRSRRRFARHGDDTPVIRGILGDCRWHEHGQCEAGDRNHDDMPHAP